MQQQQQITIKDRNPTTKEYDITKKNQKRASAAYSIKQQKESVNYTIGHIIIQSEEQKRKKNDKE